VDLRVGTSGFAYPHWRGVLYPARLPPRLWLPAYARVFDAVELNATFYRLPRPGNAAAWAAQVPPDFRFAAKGSRFVTHMKQLHDPGPGLARFFAALRDLGPKRGPILWQLPARLRPDPPRLLGFLEALPPGPHAFEFRRADWLTRPILEAIDRAGAALVVHDLLDVAWPWPPPGGFVYLRFHGAGARYGGRYGARALRPWAERLARLRRDRWVFFNNDLGGAAVHDARALRELLGLPPPAPWPLPSSPARPGAPRPRRAPAPAAHGRA
jgi:uncharacterized protein YecE (DUF72 family)